MPFTVAEQGDGYWLDTWGEQISVTLSSSLIFILACFLRVICKQIGRDPYYSMQNSLLVRVHISVPWYKWQQSLVHNSISVGIG